MNGRHISSDEATRVGAQLGLDWTKIDLDQFRRGLEVELEHGARDPETNVTNDILALTGKIAWAHLKELPDYYMRLDRLEAEAGAYGASRPAQAGTRPRPSVIASVRDRAVLAAALDPILTIDIAGTIQSASNSVERVFGWKPAELVGRNVNVLMLEPHHSAHDGYLARYHETGRTNILNRPRRFDAVRKDGGHFPMELSVSRADIPGQAGPLFVGIIRDLTEHAGAERREENAAGAEDQTRLHELLAEQTSALQSAHLRLRMVERLAALGTFAAGLGHDLSNLLLPLRTRLSELLRRSDLPASAMEDIAGLAGPVEYLGQLSSGMRQFARNPDEGWDHARTDLSQWLGKAQSLIRTVVPASIELRVERCQGLPPVAVPAHALSQVVLNLVHNAANAIVGADGGRAGRAGGGRIDVRCGLEDETGMLRLSVHDNGPGMTEEVRRRCMEPFYTTKAHETGTGLGLATVHGIVARAGGSVEVESMLGGGTTVTLHLPVCGETPAEGSAGSRPPRAVTLGDTCGANPLGVEPGGQDFEVKGTSSTGINAGVNARSRHWSN